MSAMRLVWRSRDFGFINAPEAGAVIFVDGLTSFIPVYKEKMRVCQEMAGQINQVGFFRKGNGGAGFDIQRYQTVFFPIDRDKQGFCRDSEIQLSGNPVQSGNQFFCLCFIKQSGDFFFCIFDTAVENGFQAAFFKKFPVEGNEHPQMPGIRQDGGSGEGRR